MHCSPMGTGSTEIRKSVCCLTARDLVLWEDTLSLLLMMSTPINSETLLSAGDRGENIGLFSGLVVVTLKTQQFAR